MGWVALGALACVAGCGSGKDGGGEAGSGAASNDSGAICPHAVPDDIWLDQRLGCLQVGQMVSEKVAKATESRADRAFIIRQHTVDSNFGNVLGQDVGRYFKYLLCVRDISSTLSEPVTSSLDVDLVGAFRLASVRPPEVGASTLSISGLDGFPVADMPCDPALHPVIVGGDGRVESVNPDALGSLIIADKK